MHQNKQSLESGESPHSEKESLPALHLTENYCPENTKMQDKYIKTENNTVQKLVMNINRVKDRKKR